MKAATPRSRLAAVEERIDRRDYRGALSLLSEFLPMKGSGLSERERLAVDVLTAECFAFLGRCRDAVSISRKAAQVLRRGDDHALFGRACFVGAIAHYYMGEIEDAIESCTLAIFSFKRTDDHANVVRSLNWLGIIVLYKSDYVHALGAYAKALSLARKHQMRRWVAVVRDNIARAHLLTGHLREARASLRGNGRTYEAMGDRLNPIRNSLSLAYLEIQERRFVAAQRRLSTVRPHLDAAGGLRDRGVWFEYMGELQLNRGHLEEAVVHLEQAIHLSDEEGPDESVIGQSRRLLAEVRLAQGNLNEALAECDRALVSIRKVGERFEEGVVFRVIAEVHSRRGEREPAIQAFRQSVDILRTIGARLEWAKTCLAAGRCALFGDRERLAYLFEAEQLFAEIGVEYWTQQTRSTLAEILQEKPAESTHHLAESPEKSGESVMITVDAETRNTMHMAWSWAQQDMAVLITGETGTGKDLLARYIHSVSPRRSNPFVTIDLNTIPESLLESELFGHRKGTFTGACEEKAGLLETASGGTVFLNEIGNLPLGLQAKLLEFLDTRQIRRLGDTHLVTLDVRFVAATNRPLQEAVEAGLFRDDLYFRLEQAPLHLVPLRSRRENILPLMRCFLADFRVAACTLESLPEQAWVIRATQQPWPGNIRQLRSFLWRLVALAGPNLNAEFDQWAERLMDYMDGPYMGSGNGNGHGNGDSDESMRGQLMQSLGRHKWNQRAAARDLEMSEGNIRHLIRRLNIEKPMEAVAAY